MKVKERFKAAMAAFRVKNDNATATVGMNELLDFLGVDRRNPAALSEATYFACLKVLSESIGKLPLKVQQTTPARGVQVVRGHRYYRMLNERPNRFMTASVFWATMEMCRNHYGNAYAWIDTRDPAAPQLWPLDPTLVQVYYDNAKVLADAPDVYYRWSTPQGGIVLSSEEVLHFKSHNTLDGLVGISVREQLASSIKGGTTAQTLLNDLMAQGMTAKAVLQYTGSLNDANVKKLLAEVIRYTRSKDTGNVVPLPLGFNLTPLNLKLADSQFLELRQYGALQIASAFGVKPYQVGDYTKSSYASAEAQQLSFLVDTLLFIVKGYEEEIGWKLLSDKEEKAGYHAKFNTAVLLRADHKTQIETLSTAVNNFIYTPNEARSLLDLPWREGGDQLLGNGSAIPVTLIGSQYTSDAPKEEAPAEEEEENNDTTGEEETNGDSN